MKAGKRPLQAEKISPDPSRLLGTVKDRFHRVLIGYSSVQSTTTWYYGTSFHESPVNPWYTPNAAAEDNATLGSDLSAAAGVSRR